VSDPAVRKWCSY